MQRLPLSTLAAGLVGLVLVPAVAIAGEAGGEDELPGVGAEAPGFTLPVYNSEAAGQARAGTMLLVGDDVEAQGVKVILISFMASHCKPCKKELPFLQQLHEKHKPDGLRIVGVSIDSEPEGQKAMADILAEAKVSFPVAKDGYNFVARRYLGTKVPLPSVFLVDNAGKITYVSRGYSEEISRTLLGTVETALGVPPTPVPEPEPAASPEKPAEKKEPGQAAKAGKTGKTGKTRKKGARK